MEKIVAAGILPICVSTGRALLSKRHPHVMYGDMWASWGGKFEVELDTTPQDCAKREFYEETRIGVPFHFMKEPIHVYEDERVIYYIFIGLFEDEVEADILTEGGLADQKWFALGDFPDPLMPEFKEMLDAKTSELERILDAAKESMPELALHCLVKSGITITEVDFGSVPIGPLAIVGKNEPFKTDDNGE